MGSFWFKHRGGSKLTTEMALWQKYNSYFPIGTCVSPEILTTHKQLLIKHFNSFTAENHMKAAAIHPQPSRYDFTTADQIVDFACTHKKLVRGHTLVWHNQNPDWLFVDQANNLIDRKTLLKRMKEHIYTVLNHYHNQVYCWDVVNEAIEDSKDAFLRNSPWLRIIGPEYINHAFIYAHEADPDTLLFYNDYNACDPEKRDKIMQLLTELKQQDIPIDGIGIQGHWNIYGPSIENIKIALDTYAQLDLQIQFTEVDMSVFNHDDHRTYLSAPTSKMMDLQTQRYDDIFTLFREYKDVITGITFWGAADDHTWLDNFPVKRRKNWPLLFDQNHVPKHAFHRITAFE